MPGRSSHATWAVSSLVRTTLAPGTKQPEPRHTEASRQPRTVRHHDSCSGSADTNPVQNLQVPQDAHHLLDPGEVQALRCPQPRATPCIGTAENLGHFTLPL